MSSNPRQEGLMGRTDSNPPSEVMQSFLDALSPRTGPPLTVQQQLEALTETERRVIMNMATGVQMSARLKQMTNNQQYSYFDMVEEMYGTKDNVRKQLVADLLDEIAPLQYTPTGLPTQPSAADRAAKLYESWAFVDQSDETSSQPSIPAAPVYAPPAANTRSLVQRPSSSFKSKDDFLARMTPVAKEVAADLGISHKIVLAQAALESGWGKALKGNNFFGIKSHGKAGGADVVTHEVIDGERVKITDSFRQYETPEDSIRGYGQFLKDNKRYKPFLKAGASGNETTQLSALQSSGYATDPKYGQKLAAIIKGIPDDEAQA